MIMQKEKITAERIVSEYEIYHQRSIKPIKIAFASLIVLMILLIARYVFYDYIISQVLYTIYWLYAVYWNVRSCIRRSKRIRKMRSGDYKIVANTLSNKDTHTVGSRLSLQQAYYLYFSKDGKHRINYGTAYPLSREHSMSNDALYYESDYGDKFYLVICENKIIYAYNAKWFEPEGIEVESHCDKPQSNDTDE